MPAGDTAAATPLTRDQVLAELDFLASVEHSLIVEYLSVHCALGHDLEPTDAGTAAQNVAAAAGVASSAAQSEMVQLSLVKDALLSTGAPPLELTRAESVRGTSAAAIPLGPLSRQQLEQLVARELELARAVDERYARLRDTVAATPALFDGDVLVAVNKALDAADHSLFAADLKKKLDGIPPSVYLRATPHAPKDDLEERLLDLSDHSYRLLVRIVQIFFNPADQGVEFADAVDTMNAVDKVNRVLVGRELLPPFTPVFTVADPALG
jgi:hypothetical protein